MSLTCPFLSDFHGLYGVLFKLCGRSLESLGRCCVDWRWVSLRWLPPRSDVLLFAAGVGAILHCYSDSNGVHRDVFR